MQDDSAATWTLHIKRMQNTRATVDELRTQIRLATEVTENRQRLIYHGRVLKLGNVLSTYGMEDGSVIHLVERPMDAPEASNEQPPPQRGPFPRAGMMFHSMEVDPSMGPLSMAGQVTQSLMGAFSHLLGQNMQQNANGPASGALQSTQTANVASSPSIPSATPPRAVSRPTRRICDAGGMGKHCIVHTETKRALTELSSKLQRVSTFSDGSSIFPLDDPSEDVGSSPEDAESLQKNVGLPPEDIEPAPEDKELVNALQSFERTYLTLASGCRELHEGMARGILARDQLQNLVAMLQEIPLLMIVQRRLLSTLKVRPNGGFELPQTMEVPGFLNCADNLDERAPGEPSE